LISYDFIDKTHITNYLFSLKKRGRRGCVRMVVGFNTVCTISTYHHKRCEFKSHSGDTLCDKVCQ